MGKLFWCSSSGRIEIEMSLEQAQSVTHPGQCDADVRELSRQPDIREQTEKLEPAVVARELKEYGAWDATELADHEQNIQRLLWIASGDICDGFTENRTCH